MADKQYVALAGNPTGRIELVDYRQPPGQTNKILRQDGDLTPGSISLGDIIPPDGWDGQDSLKVSGVENYTIYANHVVGGSEDVVDINHSHNSKVFIQVAEPKGLYVMTQKGGSRNMDVTIFAQVGHGKSVDYDLGNYSQQSKDPTTGAILCVPQAANATLRVGHADYPALPCGKVHYQWFMSIALKVYVWFKNKFIWPN